MRRATLLLIGALVVGWFCVRADEGRIRREQFAQGMSEEGGYHYFARGWLSTTLELSAKRGNRASCDGWTDTVRFSSDEGWTR
jgi:hypothetical protein